LTALANTTVTNYQRAVRDSSGALGALPRAKRGLTNLTDSVDTEVYPSLRLRSNQGLVIQVGNTRQQSYNYRGLVPDIVSCMAFCSMLLGLKGSRAGAGLFSSASVRSLCGRAVGEE
jgi:hypothetical protein